MEVQPDPDQVKERPGNPRPTVLGHTPARASVTVVSAVVSLALHGSVLASVLFWIEGKPGAIELPTEAISIVLFASEVIEDLEAPPALDAAGSPASIQSVLGDLQDSPAALEHLHSTEPEQQAVTASAQVDAETSVQTTFGQDVIEGASEGDVAKGQREDLPAAASGRDETKPEKEPTKAPKTKKTEERDTKEKPSPARRKGGAQSRASSEQASSSSRVSGSTGSAMNYAALVRARVASRKPAGASRRGTVVVSFGVSRSGALAFASLARSSGNPGLDNSVLAAVRSAGPFPAPPPGAGLRFAMPFYFR